MSEFRSISGCSPAMSGSRTFQVADDARAAMTTSARDPIPAMSLDRAQALAKRLSSL